MLTSSKFHSFVTRAVSAALCAVVALSNTAYVSAADATFVGILAVAVEKDTAQQLGLSDDVRQQLLELVDRREAEALEIVLQNKDLPAAEQAAKLAPFVAESERMGLELLTVAQRETLRQIRIRRDGMRALEEPGLAASLGLTDEQKATVAEMLKEMDADMTKGGESQRRITQAIYERKLAGVLTQKQRAAWEKLAGLVAADAELAAVDDEMPTPDDTNQPADPPKDPVSDDAADPQADKPATTAEPPEDAVADTGKPTDTTENPETGTEGAQTANTTQPDETASSTEQPVADSKQPVDDGKLRFSFQSTPWKDVLDWFAEQAEMSLAIETLPVGTFTYSDENGYTVDEAIDLMNSYLLTKGYTLVRRERILVVIDLESPVPEELVTLVTLEELDKRGKYELVKCLFPLAKIKAEDAEAMLEGYMGPQGDIVAFPGAWQILVTETAGKLRTIRDMIKRIESPDAGGLETVVEFKLAFVSADEVLEIARPLLGLEEGSNTGEDISLSTGVLSKRIYATGEPEQLQLLRELIPKLDIEPDPSDSPSEEPSLPVFRTYYVKAASLEVAHRVLSTMLANLPGVRMDIDDTSGKVIAMARPEEHEIIERTLAQLAGQAQKFEVIPLKRTDPELAVAAVTKFFGLTVSEEGLPVDPNAPIVDGDPVLMQLWVRGTEDQIEQIKDLVTKLEGADEDYTDRGTTRLIPLTGDAAVQALDTVERFWTGKNEIRRVTPSALTPSGIRLRTVNPPAENPAESAAPSAAEPAPAKPATRAQPTTRVPDRESNKRTATAPVNGIPVHFTSQPNPQRTIGGATPAATQASAAAEIRIAITPAGILIASDDTEALDQFEDLLRTVTGPTAMAPQPEITVFYLKYAKVDVASQLIKDILGGTAVSDDLGGSLLGDMASSMLGGGLMGSLLGGMAGGGAADDAGGATTIQASGTVSIVPDPRLNALVVQANPDDLKLIEQLLKVIDTEDSITQIQTAGVPRLIPVIYSSAEDIANVVKQVFANQIESSGGGGGNSRQRQPDPAEFIRALRGQRGGGGNNNQARGEVAKMTVGVDARSNSIIVTGPEGLFKQVQELVEQIDQPGDVESDVVTIVPIRTNAETLQKTLNSILQNQRTTSGSSGSSGSSSDDSNDGRSSADQIRQRMEFFQRLQGAAGGGRTPSFGGRGGGGGPTGGFGGRGGGDRGGGGRRGR